MKRSKWAKWWIVLLVAFIVTDIIASKPPHAKPRSASEYLGHLFPRGWKRALLIGIMAVLFIHIATQPQRGRLVEQIPCEVLP